MASADLNNHEHDRNKTATGLGQHVIIPVVRSVFLSSLVTSANIRS